jgi:outer membrane protein OmpA-like peptidoglycan-associated protein/tetratricopeptide (TPR) repeat protein
MRSIRLSLALLLTIHFSVSFSQSKKHWIEEGDKYFKQHEYSTAIAFYLKSLDDTTAVKNSKVLPYEVQMVNQKFKKDSTKAKVIKDTGHVKQKSFLGFKRHTDLRHTSPYDYALIQLAHSYLLNSDNIDALNRYKEAVDRQVPDARYFYAVTLMEMRRYQDAMAEFEKYATEAKNDSLATLAQKKQAGCYMGLDSAKVNKEMVISLLDTTVFNKGNSSFAVQYYLSSNKVLFSAARKGNTVLDPKKEEAEYLCDLYTSELNDKTWSDPVNIKGPINTNLHEGAACVTENAIYFTRWVDGDPKSVSIWKANKQEDRFFTPQKLGTNVNIAGFRSMHPSVSQDGKRFFFASDRPGGKGGLDIWMCSIDESGTLGEAKNLGQPVNTAGDETTPFLHVLSGMLYFSSNGLPGLGGLDIFKSEFNAEDGTFGMPINLNGPINSSKDDAYYVQEKTVAKGFFSSDRAECPGGNCYKVYSFESKPVVFDISGMVFDGTTNEPLAGALVSIINVHKGDESIFVISDEKGNYFAELKGNSEYFLKAQKNKYLADAGSETTKDKAVTTHFEKDFFLNKIPAGEIEIAGIEYDFNSAALRPTSMANLDKIVDLMNLNNNLSMDIEANTDSRGNDAYNMKLSQARAQSCVDYLVSKGIDASRLRAKGYGETNPLIKDEEIKKMKPKSEEWEAAHQKNRRTALRVVGESEIKIINKGQ